MGEGAQLCCGNNAATLQARDRALRRFPIHNPTRVAVELHAAERAALVEIADGIGRQFGLLGEGVLAKILSPAGRTIAEVVGAVIVPPRALVVGGAVENFEMNGGM